MKRWVYRRPFFRVARPKIPLFRSGQPLGIRRRARIVVKRVRVHRRRALVFGTPPQFLPVFPRQLPRRGNKTFTLRHRIIPPIVPFTPTFGMPIIVQKAIARIRRAFQFRLRYKPKRFQVPDVPTTMEISYPRGEIQSAGAEAGHVYVAGSKRGWVE